MAHRPLQTRQQPSPPALRRQRGRAQAGPPAPWDSGVVAPCRALHTAQLCLRSHGPPAHSRIPSLLARQRIHKAQAAGICPGRRCCGRLPGTLPCLPGAGLASGYGAHVAEQQALAWMPVRVAAAACVAAASTRGVLCPRAPRAFLLPCQTAGGQPGALGPCQHPGAPHAAEHESFQVSGRWARCARGRRPAAGSSARWHAPWGPWRAAPLGPQLPPPPAECRPAQTHQPRHNSGLRCGGQGWWAARAAARRRHHCQSRRWAWHASRQRWHATAGAGRQPVVRRMAPCVPAAAACRALPRCGHVRVDLFCSRSPSAPSPPR